jgi:hypothetical protein
MKRIGFLLVAALLYIGVQTASATVNVDSLKNELKQEVVQTSKELREQQKDSLMLSKLSPTQLLELKKQEFEVEKQRIENEGHSDMPLNGLGIVMICLLPFLFVVSIIYIGTKARNRESQRRYDIYMKSIEMGQTIPENFFDEPKKANPSSNLKKGILWLVVGLGIVISFMVIHQRDGLILGIIPAFVGIGYLLVHFLEKPKTDSIENNEQHG